MAPLAPSTLAVGTLATGISFLALDAVWLGTMASRVYRPNLNGLMIEDGFRFGPAAAFYLLYLAGMVFFALLPAFESGRWTTALGHGAAFGLLCYGTYNLTNLATLKDWSGTVTAVDMAWGTVATALACTAGFLVTRYVLGR